MGQAFMNEDVLNPFDELDTIIKNGQPSDLHFVDFHAEATGEKMAFAYAFDGKVSAIVGTHTHIQTADNRILPHGTAYLSDLGMCGPHQSVLGVKKEIIIQRLWKQEKAKHEIDLGDEAQFNALLITFNDHLHVETTQRFNHVVNWRMDHA
jgi:calcineurin-like phosphoesterase